MPRPLASAALALLLAAAAGAQPAADPSAPLVRPRVLMPSAGRVDWAPRGDYIAYDRTDADGYSRLYVALPDGGNARCLTCQPLEFRKRHTGNPAWHPSGRYLVFEVAKPFRRGGAVEPLGGVPGRNLGSELWAIRFDGRTFWQLTRVGERGGRVHAPRFSHEGDRLVWSERVAAGGGGWGEWDLRVAEIAERRGTPTLRRVRTHRVGRGFTFHEPYGFTGDDRGVLVGAESVPGKPAAGLALFVVRLDGSDVRRLTGAAAGTSRFARLAPNGRWLAYGSDRDLPRSRGADPAALDVWLAQPDGGSPRRLTGFNDVFSDSYSGPVTLRSIAWGPEGDRLVAVVAPRQEVGDGTAYLVELGLGG